MSCCRSCGSEVLWVRTTNGTRMPLDPLPVDAGNVAMVGTAAADGSPLVEVVDPHAPQLPLVDALAPRYVSHFATCPDADRWRRRG
jgi:hypothetical protein